MLKVLVRFSGIRIRTSDAYTFDAKRNRVYHGVREGRIIARNVKKREFVCEDATGFFRTAIEDVT